MTVSAIQLKHVSKSYDRVTAVNDISFTVSRGEILVLLGPSGCGKTTTLRLLAGIETPDTGEIWLGGQCVAGKNTWIPPEQRKVGLVFQDYALFPHLSVEQNILFGLKGWTNDEKRRRTADMLAVAGLDSMGKRMPHELSGGQQQRVALARALAPQPDVILLDEPFSNLDAALRGQVRAEVRSILKQTGITSVFVTHDQEEALSLGDQIAVMSNGRIAQMGTAQTVYHRPASREVAAFVGEANFLPAEAHGETASCVLGEVELLEPAQGHITLMIRPEALRLTVNDTNGMIQGLEFFGHDQRIHVLLDDGTPLIVRADSSEVYTEAQRVGVGVQRAALAFDS